MNLNILIKLPVGFTKPVVTIDEESGANSNGCAQTARFVPTPSKSEVVLDNSTGLMWDAAGSEKRMTHKEAEAYVKTLKLGGFTDWRLPTVQELLTLVDYSRTNPAIDTSAFSCKSECYWTGTPYAGVADSAWYVYFGGGGSNWYYRYGDFCVRAVRASQS